MTEQAFDLVLGSGGSKGFSHLGLLKALEELAIPLGDKTGVSIGSLAAVFSERYCAEEVFEIFFEELADPDFLGATDRLFYQGIFNGGVELQERFKQMVARYGLKGHDSIHIIAYDLLTRQPVVFEGDNYDLATALAASCAVPLVMRPVVERAGSIGLASPSRTRVLVDGAVYHPYPTICCRRPAIISKLGPVRQVPSQKLGMADYVLHMLDLGTASVYDRVYCVPPEHHVIDVGLPDAVGLSFDVTKERCRRMFDHAYQVAKVELQRIRSARQQQGGLL